MHYTAEKAAQLITQTKVNPSWSFTGLSRKETSYITHGYHHYPAKFIPQIAARLIKKYTVENDVIVDPFGGCGTTVVEAKAMGRIGLAVDINPVATLITQAKKKAIEPSILAEELVKLKELLEGYDENQPPPPPPISLPQNERIDYWFHPKQKKKLAYLLAAIKRIKDKEIQGFFACAFSNILKSCSIWLQKSNKPTRDIKKQASDPFQAFIRHAGKMLKGNLAFYELLQKKSFSDKKAYVFCEDARKIPTEDKTVKLIVTSPPYVTSYEYADLHQLSALWFAHTEDIRLFRQKFIGTSCLKQKTIDLNSHIADDIIHKLESKHTKTAREVATYFSEMQEVFTEMKRTLKQGGRAAIVIGNTRLKGIDILNAEVFTEQLMNLGFTIEDTIKRQIPSKNLPSTRHPKTGRFAKATDPQTVVVYPTEYIIIAQKT